MALKIAFLWAEQDLGLYSNRPFDALFKGIGHNNGNLAFVYAITSQIEGRITYLPWHTSAEKLNTFDVVVIPCANQFGGHTELSGLARIYEKVDKPVVAIGLGAQADNLDTDVTVQDGTLDWVRAIDARRGGTGSNIYTRGPYTTRQLARFGVDSVSGGCPSHFISHANNLGKLIERSWRATKVPRSISVAGGHQSWAKVRSVEQQLVSLMMDPACFGQYVTQSMGDMIRISRASEFDEIDPVNIDKIRKHIVPHYTTDEFRAWCRNYARSFYNVPAWMDSLRNYDLTIGPRYHGTQLAIQAGKMGIVVTIDSRTEELCAETGVPYINHKELQDRPLTRSELKTLVPFDGAGYDQFRQERAQRYINFLEANGLTAKPFLHKIAEGRVVKPVVAPAQAAAEPAAAAPVATPVAEPVAVEATSDNAA